VQHVDLGPSPPSLTTPKADAERAALRAFYSIPGNEKLPYDKGFTAYKGDGVREQLTEMFKGKCAYCETFYKATQPADIEHFRPKGGVTIKDTRPQPPGYWWLASEWSNLLPSCSDCNRPRRQDFPGGLPRTAGKANRFPLASEAKRAAAPGQEAKERRLLLHPSLTACTPPVLRHAEHVHRRAPAEHSSSGDEWGYRMSASPSSRRRTSAASSSTYP